jgi:alpha-glucosidase
MSRIRRCCFLLCLLVLIGVLQACAQKSAMPANTQADQADWWKHAVFYEIYPRSFADSNNDGTGDLNGITAHLDYLAALGVDAIWITPCFPSPQVDFGYDVSDYRNIDPQYGTLADMDTLIAEAKKRNIKVVLDFVINHTSDKHKWFLESKESRTNPYRDYYIWRDGKGPGKPPNNWASIFGGPSWKFDASTNQWYYHFFYPEQPDLNWRNPKVESEMFDNVRFWYQRGVYGFRLDAVDTLFEDPQLHDNPVLPGKDAYGMPNQEHVYDHRMAEVHAELQRLRKVDDEYPGRVLIGETWTDDPKKTWEYFGPSNNELQMPMYFNFTNINKLDPAEFRKKIAAMDANPVGGWPVYVLSNHDLRRHIERYGDGVHNDQIARLMAAFYLTLRGTPIMYYGEELGMNNNDPKRIEDVKDVIGKKGWPKEKGRDGERTPMQWNSTVNAGFDTGAKTWLPVADNYKTKNVATENGDSNSMLNWYRQLIALRRTEPALYEGQYIGLNEGDPNVMAYLRKSAGERILVVLNMTAAPQRASFDAGKTGGSKGTVLLGSSQAKTVELNKVSLEPFGVVIAKVE